MMTRGMMFHKLLFSLVFLFVCMSGNAQTDYTAEELAKTTGVKQRLGHKRDSVEAFKFYNEYAENLGTARKTNKAEDWKKCYRPWKELMYLAPYATYSQTHPRGGVRILVELMAREPDPIQRYVYFKDVIATDNFRIQNWKKLNAIREKGYAPLSRGSVLLGKAHNYYSLAVDSSYIPENVYRRDSAYQYFVDAFTQIRRENVGTENEIETIYLAEYFFACRDLYLSDKEKYMEQFLTDYTTCIETCDKMMAVYANGVDSVKWRSYANMRNNTQYYFNGTGAGNLKNLESFFSPRIQQNKENYKFLSRAIHMMLDTNDSILNSPMFATACRYSYKQQPDFENCIGLGAFEKANAFDSIGIKTSKKFFDEAVNYASNDKECYLANYMIAQGLASEDEPSDKNQDDWNQISVTDRNERKRLWAARQVAAARKFKEALDYAEKANMPGQTLAPIYYSMALSFSRGGTSEYIQNAWTCYNNVTAVNPAFGDGNNKMELLRTNISKREKIVLQNEENERRSIAEAKDRAKAQKKYDDYMAKRKAEEDFWTKK